MEPGDYKFRYKIEEPADAAQKAGDRPTEMIRQQLRNLLDLVVLCDGETELKVDGFKLDGHRNHTYRLESSKDEWDSEADGSATTVARSSPFENPRNAALYEPRIELIKKQLETVLPLVELECKGDVVSVDAFRLRDLQHWVSASNCDPAEVFEHLGTRCNCDCVFCYNDGTPPAFALHRRPKSQAEELSEVETRLKYFDPLAKRSLFLSLGSTCEVLLHPSALHVLGMLRKKTDRPFRMPTNGVPLTSEVILDLAKLRPVFLDVSINSSSPSRRSLVMRDRHAEAALRSLPLLRDAGIPYSVVIVPWPIDSLRDMLDDLARTVDYAASNDVSLVQISLPGYSRFLSERKLFDRDEVWSSIVYKVQGLRGKYDQPIVVMPGMYEENLCRRTKNLPEVIGTIVNSPAARAGIRSGDLIKRIGGLVVRNRPQARDILSTLQHNSTGMVAIVVRRDGHEIGCNLDLESYAYPYSRETATHLGTVFMGTGLRTGYLEQLDRLIRSRDAKNVLFLSSELVRPTFEQCLDQCSFLRDVKLEVAVPENRYLGGNIFMGDLLVMDDFVSCIKDRVAGTCDKPDLIVIPSSPFSLGEWGRDLTGRTYRDIERQVGIPVELLQCETIFD